MVRSFADFALVDTYVGDIDPTYWAIYRAAQEWSPGWAAKFCVGMLAYYHMGTAARAADFDGAEFWDCLADFYNTAPRASERRHQRGELGHRSLASMKKWSFEPTEFFEEMPDTYAGVVSICSNHLVNFGPYFQLKICDYMDRCLDLPIRSYHGLAHNLPTLPAKAAIMRYPSLGAAAAFNQCCIDIPFGLLAAPLFERAVGPAEVETILCDWKRAKTGSSWIGADIAEKRAALAGYGPKADEMAKWLPPNVDRGLFKLELE